MAILAYGTVTGGSIPPTASGQNSRDMNPHDNSDGDEDKKILDNLFPLLYA
jgi:hypothetical protein